MPSSGRARQAILATAECNREGPVIDLGSGWGHLALACAGKYPDREVIGYELSLVPYWVSVVRKYLTGRRNVSFYRRDFLETDLSGAALLLCYLSPHGMSLLRQKLEKEAGGGTLLVSNTFALPSCRPEKVIRLDDMYGTPIYVYCFFRGRLSRIHLVVEDGGQGPAPGRKGVSEQYLQGFYAP